MKFGRSPAAGEPALIAALESARSELLRIEGEAAAMVAAARTQVVAAQSRVDEFRVGLVREHAAAWREHAQRLREQAEGVGDETVVVPVRRFGGQGDLVEAEPQLRYRRAVLLEQSDAAAQHASWLDGYLQRGVALTSQDLAVLVSQLEPLPEAAETVAA
jgi:hypothetical protein